MRGDHSRERQIRRNLRLIGELRQLEAKLGLSRTAAKIDNARRCRIGDPDRRFFLTSVVGVVTAAIVIAVPAMFQAGIDARTAGQQICRLYLWLWRHDPVPPAGQGRGQKTMPLIALTLVGSAIGA